MANTMEVAPRKPAKATTAIALRFVRKGSSSAETASGRAIKVRNRNSSTAGRMMAGIWDGKESRPSRKKMDICAMPVIPSK